jgi:hypothetical protein
MAGFLSHALGALFCENVQLIEDARIVAALASCRPVTVQSLRDVQDATSVPVVQWAMHFNTAEDALAFDAAMQRIIAAVNGDE